MRPYGVRVIPSPDCGDIAEMACKSSVGSLTGRSGLFHNSIRSARPRPGPAASGRGTPEPRARRRFLRREMPYRG